MARKRMQHEDDGIDFASPHLRRAVRDALLTVSINMEKLFWAEVRNHLESRQVLREAKVQERRASITLLKPRAVK